MTWLFNVLGLLNPLKWAEKGWNFFKRPKLRLFFDPAETYRTRAVVDAGNVPGFFCHLMVSNDGKEIARNCRARVIDILVRDRNGNFSRHPLFSHPFVLKWAHEPDFCPKDIENDLPRRLDLCYGLQSRPDNLFFFTEQKPDGNLTIYPPGSYRVRIRVDATNTKAVDKTFDIQFQGGWNLIAVSDPVLGQG